MHTDPLGDRLKFLMAKILNIFLSMWKIEGNFHLEECYIMDNIFKLSLISLLIFAASSCIYCFWQW